jgi:hypothetical protein
MRFISEIILYHDEDLDSSILRIKICNIGDESNDLCHKCVYICH